MGAAFGAAHAVTTHAAAASASGEAHAREGLKAAKSDEREPDADIPDREGAGSLATAMILESAGEKE